MHFTTIRIHIYGIMADENVYEPKFVKIAENLLGAEGPVFDRDENFYMVAPEVMKDELYAGQVLKVDIESGKVEVLCEPNVNGDGGIPAGCQCDKEDSIWIADMRLGILKVKRNGDYEQVCTVDKDGDKMQGCNDCSFDYNGGLWVTAPAGEIAPDPYRRSFEGPFGSVYYYSREKKEAIKIDTGMWFPNGIAVLHTPDGRPKKLIVAETKTKSLWGYDILGPGEVGPKSLWAKLPNTDGGPDGMDFDQDNNLLVAHHGSSHLMVYGPEGGDPHTWIKCPFRQPSNLHFKKGTNTVFVTEHDNHALWKFDWKRPGKMQYCDVLSL